MSRLVRGGQDRLETEPHVLELDITLKAFSSGTSPTAAVQHVTPDLEGSCR